MESKIGCGKKLRKAFSKGVIVFCGDYNEEDDYIHLCKECRCRKDKKIELETQCNHFKKFGFLCSTCDSELKDAVYTEGVKE